MIIYHHKAFEVKNWSLTQKLTFRIFLIVSTVTLIVSIAGTMDVLTTSALPASYGYVKVTLNRQDHYVIQLYLNNIFPSIQSPSSKQYYVVWMESDRGIAKNIGAIKQTTTLFSHPIKKTLKPCTPLKPARIYITAEDDPAIQYSKTNPVFSTGEFLE